MKWICYGNFLLSYGLSNFIFLWGYYYFFSFKNFEIFKNSIKNFYKKWACLLKIELNKKIQKLKTLCESSNFSKFFLHTFYGDLAIISVHLMKTKKLIKIGQYDIFIPRLFESDQIHISKDGIVLIGYTISKLIFVSTFLSQKKVNTCFVIDIPHMIVFKSIDWGSNYNNCIIGITQCGKILKITTSSSQRVLFVALFFSDLAIQSIKICNFRTSGFFNSPRGDICIYPIITDRPFLKRNLLYTIKNFFFFSFSKKQVDITPHSCINSGMIFFTYNSNIWIARYYKLWVNGFTKRRLFLFTSHLNVTSVNIDCSISNFYNYLYTKLIFNPRNDELFFINKNLYTCSLWSITTFTWFCTIYNK